MEFQLLTEPLLLVCENEEEYFRPGIPKIEPVTEYDKSGLQLFRFEVKARQWKRLSATDRFAEIIVPAISDAVIGKGTVMVYLSEAGRHASLPFTYYQLRRAISFQPSYEKGRVYINILGNFILNVHDSYTFKVLVVSGNQLKTIKRLNWNNFEEVKRFLLK